MRRCSLGWLLLCTALLGCGAASEGGVTGTGISASVTGNISLVSDAASAALPFPILVSIDAFPGIESTTDAEGTFALRGPFSGAITLQFANALSGAPIGPLALEVPAGSETVLENIEIRTAAPLAERVRPNAVRQFDVFGHLDLVECRDDGTGVLLVSDDGRPPRQFMVQLSPDTILADREGSALACAELTRGNALRVEGLLRLADQTLIALDVTVAVRRTPPQPGPRPERLRGVVSAVNCMRGAIEVVQRADAEPVRRFIHLVEDTVIECAGDPARPCTCADIDPGDPIGVGGTIAPQRPGVITATRVLVGAVPEPVTLIGVVTVVACEADRIDLRDLQDPTVGWRAVLSPRTEIRCGRQPCRCIDLRPRDRVRVEGTRAADQPRLIAADRLTVLPR